MVLLKYRLFVIHFLKGRELTRPRADFADFVIKNSSQANTHMHTHTK